MIFNRKIILVGLIAIALVSPLGVNAQRVTTSLGGSGETREVVEANRDELIQVNAIPEPAFYQGLVLLLLGGAGVWRLRRKKSTTA